MSNDSSVSAERVLSMTHERVRPFSDAVLEGARIVLSRALEIARRTPLERREIVKRQGQEGYAREEISCVQWRSFHMIRAAVHQLPEFTRCLSNMRADNPECDGFIELDGGMHEIRAHSFIDHWLRILVLNHDPASVAESEIDALLEQAAATWSHRRLTFRMEVPIAGLEVPSDFLSLALEPGLTLVKLSAEEQIEIMSNPIARGPIYGSDWAYCALRFDSDHSFRVWGSNDRQADGHKLREHASEATEVVMSALHVLRAGQAREVFQQSMLLPAVLPHLGNRDTYWVPTISSLRPIKLRKTDMPKLAAYVAELSRSDRKQLLLPARRLMQACWRTREADAILDCVYALEPLLGGSNTFRVQLTFAALSGIGDQADRFATMGELVRARHKLAHGGSADDTARLSQLAINALRDVLSRLLPCANFPVEFRSDGDYWRTLLDKGNDA